MKPFVFAGLLSLCLGAFTQNEVTGSESGGLYSIHADDVITDDSGNTTTYQGNAKVVVANLVIAADTISVTSNGGLPSRIAARGNPITFSEQVPRQGINGTAREVIFIVAELKLTLSDYSIVDPSGNNMKGKKASFILSP